MEKMYVVQPYSVEVGYAKTIRLGEELLPVGDGVKVVVLEVISEGDILLETSLGARVVKANSISKFESDTKSIFSAKVIHGSGRVFVNAGVIGMTSKEALDFSRENME